MTVMTRGMPLVVQLTRMFSPWPPSAWSAMLASKIFWYSGMSGACWVRPGRLVWSHWIPAPGGRFHWPEKSGYLPVSWALRLAAGNIIAAIMAAMAIWRRYIMQGSPIRGAEIIRRRQVGDKATLIPLYSSSEVSFKWEVRHACPVRLDHRRDCGRPCRWRGRANLAGAPADQIDRAVSARQCARHHCAADFRPGRQADWPSLSVRKPAGRRRDAGYGARREGGLGRLYVPGQLFDPYDRADELHEAAVRHAARTHAGHSARPVPERDGGARGSLQERPGSGRQGESNPGLDHLWLGRHWRRDPSQCRTIPACCRIRGGACAVPRRARCGARSAWRPYRFLLLATARGDGADRIQAARRARSLEPPARSKRAEYSDNAGSRLSEFRLYLLGRRFCAVSDAEGDCATPAWRSCQGDECARCEASHHQTRRQ